MLTTDQVLIVETLLKLAAKEQFRIYLVGGAVRDIFLGHDISDKDLDFIVEGDAIKFGKLCGHELNGDVKEFKPFLTSKILAPSMTPSILEVDLATARKEVYERPGSLPTVSSGTVEEDLKRRDFTINAFAVPLGNLLSWVRKGTYDLQELYNDTLDLYGGRDDLIMALIRVLHDGSFIDDPTRIFRACRYATRINGRIEDATSRLINEAVKAGALQTVSTFRKLNEIKVIFSESRPDLVIELLSKYRVFKEFSLYEEKHEEQVFRSLNNLSNLPIKRANDFLYHVGLGIFYRYLESNQRKERYVELGFGKKYVKNLEADLSKALERHNATELSDVALIMGVIWEEDSKRKEELSKEAYGRNLFHILF